MGICFISCISVYSKKDKMFRLVKYILLFMTQFAAVSHVCAQNKPQFSVMFDFPIYLSGNFGELRSNHFHSGLDFKTQGVVGKPIKCVADGYICRAKVETGGYGQAIYVMHDNGYMTVYGHLDRFTNAVSKRVRDYQYANETFTVDLNFAPDEYRVKTGEIIAYAGNTGYSFGPHLHFEVRDSSGNELYDPMQFFKSRIKDKKPPKALALSVYPKYKRGVVEGEGTPLYIDAESDRFNDTIEVWGKVGIGVKAFDYMDGTNNKYGVRIMRLYVDGKKIFESVLDKFDYGENRLINSWVDYARLVRKGDRFQKLFLDDNMPLRALNCGDDKGWLTVNEERYYDIKVHLEDYHGNRSVYGCVLRGKVSAIMSLPAWEEKLYWARVNVINREGMNLLVPAKELFNDCVVKVDVKGTGNISGRYSIGEETVPFWHGADLSIKVNGSCSVDTSKLYVGRRSSGKVLYVGGKYSNGWMNAKIRSFGEYEVFADTVGPRIVAKNDKQWMKRGRIELGMSDSETAIGSFKGTLDGSFVLFRYSSKESLLTLDLKAENVSRGKHKFRVVAKDVLGNETVFEKEITY